MSFDEWFAEAVETMDYDPGPKEKSLMRMAFECGVREAWRAVEIALQMMGDRIAASGKTLADLTPADLRALFPDASGPIQAMQQSATKDQTP